MPGWSETTPPCLIAPPRQRRRSLQEPDNTCSVRFARDGDDNAARARITTKPLGMTYRIV
jgi:hypothetical protein